MVYENDVLTIAKEELGTKESPANSNKVKYAEWYGLNGQPWCMMFVMWVFDQAGVSLPTRTASCGALMRAAQAAGNWVTSGYKPGDVVIYDFPGGAATDHCGIVESVSDNYVTAIEGNTAVGNDSDGGEVMRRTRPMSQVVGAVRPAYIDEPDSYARDAWWKAYQKGVLDGTRPTEPVLRQQLAVILDRLGLL